MVKKALRQRIEGGLMLVVDVQPDPQLLAIVRVGDESIEEGVHLGEVVLGVPAHLVQLPHGIPSHAPDLLQRVAHRSRRDGAGRRLNRSVRNRRSLQEVIDNLRDVLARVGVPAVGEEAMLVDARGSISPPFGVPT